MYSCILLNVAGNLPDNYQIRAFPTMPYLETHTGESKHMAQSLEKSVAATASVQSKDVIPTLYVGFDRGQDTTTATSSDFQGNLVEIFMSSMVGTYDPEAFQDIASGTNYSSSDDALPGIIDIQFDGIHYIVGDAAREYATNANTNIGNRNRYHELPQKVSMLANCGLLLEKVFPGKRQGSIKLVTGMPIRTYTLEKAEMVTKELSGTYTFILCNETYTLNIDVVDVKIEGSGAAYVLASESEGEYIIVDGGSFNTAALLARGTKINPRRSDMTEVGVDQIKKNMTSSLKKKIGRLLKEEEAHTILYAYADIIKHVDTVLERETLDRLDFTDTKEDQDLLQVILAYRKEIYEKIPATFSVVNKKRTQISPMDIYESIRKAIQSVGSDLRNFFTQLYGDAQGNVALDVSSVKYIGGQSYYLKQELEKIFGEITVPEQAERINARGYSARAVAVMYKRTMMMEKGA